MYFVNYLIKILIILFTIICHFLLIIEILEHEKLRLLKLYSRGPIRIFFFLVPIVVYISVLEKFLLKRNLFPFLVPVVKKELVPVPRSCREKRTRSRSFLKGTRSRSFTYFLRSEWWLMVFFANNF